MPEYRPLRERLLEKLEPCPATGCWLFTGGLNESGYGVLGAPRSNKFIKAHRASWELHKGPIPKGVLVLHRCDVPSCCNPGHLYLGSFKDNSQDMVRKGRDFRPDNRGERASYALLNWSAARDMRKREMTQRGYAEKYGVSRSTVNQVQRNAIWREE